jgi:hypothetical protein
MEKKEIVTGTLGPSDIEFDRTEKKYFIIHFNLPPGTKPNANGKFQIYNWEGVF